MTNGVLVDEVSFDVSIPSGGALGGLLGGLLSSGGPPASAIVGGSLYRPSHAPSCTSSVLLLLHGVSQGRHVWDLQVGSLHYSVARRLASAGYPVLAIDRLGYGASTYSSGRDLTIEAHASVVAQVVTALRSGVYRVGPGLAFTHVGLLGHSLGTEIAELVAGSPSSSGDIDVLVATGYTHSTSLRLLGAMAGLLVPALLTNYVYFGGTPGIGPPSSMIPPEQTRRSWPRRPAVPPLLPRGRSSRLYADPPVASWAPSRPPYCSCSLTETFSFRLPTDPPSSDFSLQHPTGS